MERVGVTALPVEEFAHPIPLLGLGLLGLNDHVLKGSGWLPGWLTGKISDFAGLFWFPLFLTALGDTLLFAASRVTRGRSPDYSLSRAKLLGAIALTSLLFVPLKLSDAWGSLYIRAMHGLDVLGLFGGFAVARDPTDLVALSVFPLTYLFGLGFVRRVPIGRLSVLAARAARRPADDRAALIEQGMADIRTLCGRRTASIAAFDRFLEAFRRALPLQPGSANLGAAADRLEDYRASLERAA